MNVRDSVFEPAFHPFAKEAQSRKLHLWDEFCLKNDVGKDAVPLFQVAAGSEGNQRLVVTRSFGKDNRIILQRSEEMDGRIISEVNKVTDDHYQKSNTYGGLIYIMFREDESPVHRILPMYIGKAGKFGTDGVRLSANINSITKDRGKFCRWGSNYAYHIGDLSAVTCLGHPPEKQNFKYHRWAQNLFETYPTATPNLKFNVKLWIKAWSNRDIGIWTEYGPTSLEFLEYLLIGVAGDIFPNTLLNTEGITRRAPVLKSENK
jgi:hypothetical protein